MRPATALAALLLPLATGATTIEAAFSPGHAEARVVAVIGEAKSTVRVAAFSFTSKTVALALVAAKQRGVDVRLVVDKSFLRERYSGAALCVKEGIPTRVDAEYTIMHNKFIAIDGATVETGSFNFTVSAARHNAENVLIVRGDRPLAKTYETEWARLWAESTPAPAL